MMSLSSSPLSYLGVAVDADACDSREFPGIWQMIDDLGGMTDMKRVDVVITSGESDLAAGRIDYSDLVRLHEQCTMLSGIRASLIDRLRNSA